MDTIDCSMRQLSLESDFARKVTLAGRQTIHQPPSTPANHHHHHQNNNNQQHNQQHHHNNQHRRHDSKHDSKIKHDSGSTHSTQRR